MAKKVVKASNVTTRLKKKGAAQAHKKHKNDETIINQGMDLPAGIENGVAKLVEAGVFDYKKEAKYSGEIYVRIAGVVRRPVEYDSVKCKGRRVSVMIGLHDTPSKTFDDQWGVLLNDLRKLGVDTSSMSYDDLEETLADLEAEAPYFRFRTWKGTPTKQYPNPRTNTELGKRDDDFEDDEDPDSEVEDDGEVVDDENSQPEEEGSEESEVSAGDTGTAPYDGEDFSVVVDSVDGDTLTVHNAEDEKDVWDVSVSDFTPDSGEEEEEDAGPPEEGELRVYDGVEVVVDKVYPRKKTADVTATEDDEEYKSVPWDELEAAEDEE